jgi:hypothetical protein
LPDFEVGVLIFRVGYERINWASCLGEFSERVGEPGVIWCPLHGSLLSAIWPSGIWGIV